MFPNPEDYSTDAVERRPSNVLPEMDWPFVVFTRARIELEHTVGRKTVTAILIPDGLNLEKWVWVRVPLLFDLRRANHVDDVDTEMWFDAGRGGGSATSDLTRRSFHIDRFPTDEPHDLSNSFSIVVSPQHTEGPNVHPINHLINRLVPDLKEPWRGNVLVFRHGKTAAKSLINMEEKNFTAIEMIVARSIEITETFNALASAVYTFLKRSFNVYSIEIPLAKMRPRRSTRTRTRLPHAFWSFGDVVLYMLQYFTLVQVAHFGAIDKQSNEYAKTYMRGRITRYISPFLPAPSPSGASPCDKPLLLRRFFQAMDITKSWVVGSIALAIASFLSDPAPPNNLNLITSRRKIGIWIQFMLNEGHFQLRHRQWSSGPYADAGRLVLIFTHPAIKKLYITITATAAPNLGALFFATPNTDGLIAIAPHSIITPVPENVCEQRHLRGWRRDVRTLEPVNDDATHRSRARFPGATSLDFSTASWNRPCGSSCPGVWHDTHALQGWAQFSWGGVDGLDWKPDSALTLIGRSRLRYRYGFAYNLNCASTAVNFSAAMHNSNRDRSRLTLPMYTLEYAHRVNNAIHHNVPRFRKLYDGLLFAAGASAASRVLVPALLGLPSANSADELDTTWWIPVPDEDASIDQALTSITVTHWPLDCSIPLPCAFSVFVGPQPNAEDEHHTAVAAPINNMFRAETEGSLTPLRGNVIVVKHSAGMASPIVNLSKSDEALALLITKRSQHADADASVIAEQEFAILVHLRRDIRDAGLDVLAYRVRRRLAANLGGVNGEHRVRVERLLALMDGEEACIVGSTVQGLICFTEADEGNLEYGPPSDLNILANASKAGAVLGLLKSFGIHWHEFSLPSLMLKY
ncbi:hypothetical protein C8F04DRAFT_1184176 [Mycena alexandri]|uniref:Uncharacterized protein n=1 Tax=Mycena alexandri TaxID=1745969 RepID=A0AAD6SSY4_9AGAR|nr:hypothetical protein C8F04DRAFT_1184176 [Mycena alexandri]